MAQRLVAKEDHLMRDQRVVDFLDLTVAERFQRDAGNLRADPARHRFDFNDFVSHACCYLRAHPAPHWWRLSSRTGTLFLSCRSASGVLTAYVAGTRSARRSGARNVAPAAA